MPLIGELISNRYRLGERLGGIAERRTWLAVDKETSELVVFKSLFFGHTTDWQEYRSFERETQVLPGIVHPQIPKFLAVFWLEKPEGQYFCLVQQYVYGISLAEWLTQGNRFEPEQLVQLAASLLVVLEYLQHKEPQIVHRDIKPSNLILGDDGQVYLIDFGAAQLMNVATRTLTATGTFGYMAPEQFVGQALPASDLYGLGATLIHLLTGTSPANLLGYDGVLRLPNHPFLTGWFGHWLGRMVSPNLERRYVDAKTARNALQGGEFHVSSSTKPLSRLKHFLLLETSDTRTRIRFPSSPNTQKSTLISMGVGGTISTAIWPVAIVLTMFSFIEDRSWWQLELDGKDCRLLRGYGPLTLKHHSLPLAFDSSLSVVWMEPEMTRPRLKLKAGSAHFEFTTGMNREEVDWLIARFNTHRDRFCSQPSLNPGQVL